MIKKLQKSDYIFIVAMFAGLLLHFLCLYTLHGFFDETYYPTVPLRLINGDSLMQHEWHLTQFSSLFLYLPVRIWLALKGSTDGIILYLRFLYLGIHTLTSFGIYKFFRKQGIWAVAAAVLFFTQTPYRFVAISYNSMYALFLLLLTFLLLLIYTKKDPRLFIFVGICFGACCVCNPFFCTVFALYIIICIVWFQKNRSLQRKKVEISNTKRKKTEKIITQKEHYYEIYNQFFNIKAFSFFFCGICVVAVICLIYFFATGGTFSSFVGNIGNLLSASEYKIFESSLLNKLKETGKYFNIMSINMSFLLPALFAVLIFDKKRKKNTHRVVYFILAFAVAIFYIIRMSVMLKTLIYSTRDLRALSIAFPFAIVSTVCYILTESKNKKLFYCMWCPGLVGTIVQYFAANMHWMTIGWTLAIGNIAGVFFVADLFKEILNETKLSKKLNMRTKKRLIAFCYSIICVGLCSQLLFQCYTFQYLRLPKKDFTQVTIGPYAGFYMNELQYDNYLKIIKDIDTIKARSEINEPILIVSRLNWMYLCIDRPFATPSAWQETFEPESLLLYYKQNPDKIPKYVYVGITDAYIGHTDIDYEKFRYEAQKKVDIMKEIFSCTQEELSEGFLLTVDANNI